MPYKDPEERRRKYREWARAKRAADPEWAARRRAQTQAWQKAHPQRMREIHLRSYHRKMAEDPESVRAIRRKAEATRRARMRGATIHPVTPAALAAKFEFYGNLCRHCGSSGPLQADHIKPLALGGPHCLSNLQPLCASCNASKGARFVG